MLNRRSALLLPIVLYGCATNEQLALAEAEVPRFHRLYNDQQFEQIWYQATTQFQNKHPRETFVALLSSANSSLGLFRGSARTGWQALYQENVVQVTLTLKSTFERADAIELIGYRVESGSAFLATYVCNSPALRSNDA